MISIITITVLVLAKTVRMETCASLKQLPIIDVKTKEVVDIQNVCGNGTKPCMMKCCPDNEVMYKIPGIKYGFLCKNLKVLSKEYSSTAIQAVSNYSTKKIPAGNDKNVSFFEDFRMLYSDRFVDKPCSQFQYIASLRENGTAYWYPDDSYMVEFVAPEFCMDIILGMSRTDGVVKSYYAYHFRIDDPSSNINITLFSAYGGLVSVFFLLFVLVVHCLLKSLHENVKDKLLMRFVFSMMLYFVYNVWYSFNTLANLENSSTTDNTPPACKWVSPIGYYLFVSAFFWMNAMCYAIWRKFKINNIKHDSRLSKSRKLYYGKKMRWYSAYALGMPLLCTVVCVLIDQYGSDLVRPDFDNCQQDNENNIWKRLYLRLPTGLVVLSNVVMWVLTMRNIRHLDFGRTASEESTRTRNSEYLGNVYRRLFVVMGVNWLIEVVVTPIPSLKEWAYYMVVVPNTLLGVWIFIATVCKKNIFIKLCRRFGLKNKWTQNTNITQVSQGIPDRSSTARPKSSKSNCNNNNTDMD